MDESLVAALIGKSYARLGSDALKSRESQRNELLRHRKLPVEGWDTPQIQWFLGELALMDANNFPGVVGGGEREGRVVCPLVAARHGGLAHGIGRSGDLTAVQPKAAGSSLANRLCNALALDAIRLSGVSGAAAAFVLPSATGVALLLCLLHLRSLRPAASKVLWSRIDQKTCFKAILAAGLTPVVVETNPDGDGLTTDVDAFAAHMKEASADIVCCITTTSCFAPRLPDDVEAIAALCAAAEVPHLVNNAYGLQSTKLCHHLNQAGTKGRVDAFVQSTDKNFLVPVGGSVISGFATLSVEAIATSYPGRASATPSIDLLTTLLWLGRVGYARLRADRKVRMEELRVGLDQVAGEVGEHLLLTQRNPISLAMSLDTLDKDDVAKLGSMLFSRRVSGTRVWAKGSAKQIGGHDFPGWGSHCRDFPSSYLNVAAAIGITAEEVSTILARLRKALIDLRKGKKSKASDGMNEL